MLQAGINATMVDQTIDQTMDQTVDEDIQIDSSSPNKGAPAQGWGLPNQWGNSNAEMDFDRLLSHDRLQLPEDHKQNQNQKKQFSAKLDTMSAG